MIKKSHFLGISFSKRNHINEQCSQQPKPAGLTPPACYHKKSAGTDDSL